MGLETKIAIVAAALVTTILFGEFDLSSVYAIKSHVEANFEGSAVPICSSEEVVFSGTAVYDFTGKNGLQELHLKYKNTKGIGIETGTKYNIPGNDKYSTVLNENGDTTMKTVIHGTFISAGSGDNTKIEIKLTQVVHPNGDVDTIVDNSEVKCPG